MQKKPTTELHSKELPNNETKEENVEIATPKKRCISPKEKNKLLKN